MTVKKEKIAADSKKRSNVTKKAPMKRACAKKEPATRYNAEYVGFKAGDVYRALASATKPMSISGIAKTAGISEKETLLGMGWLLKEGKIGEENNLFSLI